MNRRGFLKTSLLALVAAYSPISLKREKVETVVFSTERWAPGIWAGTEGLHTGDNFEILAVDLDARSVTFRKL